MDVRARLGHGGQKSVSIPRLLPSSPGFNPRPVRVGFMVDKMSLGQVFLRIIRPNLRFIHHRRYVILATDSVLEWDSSLREPGSKILLARHLALWLTSVLTVVNLL